MIFLFVISSAHSFQLDRSYCCLTGVVSSLSILDSIRYKFEHNSLLVDLIDWSSKMSAKM